MTSLTRLKQMEKTITKKANKVTQPDEVHIIAGLFNDNRDTKAIKPIIIKVK